MRLVQPAFSSKDRVLHNFSLIGFEHIVTLNHCYVLPISRAFSFPFSPLQADWLWEELLIMAGGRRSCCFRSAAGCKVWGPQRGSSSGRSRGGCLSQPISVLSEFDLGIDRKSKWSEWHDDIYTQIEFSPDLLLNNCWPWWYHRYSLTLRLYMFIVNTKVEEIWSRTRFQMGWTLCILLLCLTPSGRLIWRIDLEDWCVCLQDLRKQVASLAQRLDILENAAKGSSGFSSWSPQQSRENRQTQPSKPDPKYETVNVSSNSNFSSWIPKQSVWVMKGCQGFSFDVRRVDHF